MAAHTHTHTYSYLFYKVFYVVLSCGNISTLRYLSDTSGIKRKLEFVGRDSPLPTQTQCSS